MMWHEVGAFKESGGHVHTRSLLPAAPNSLKERGRASGWVSRWDGSICLGTGLPFHVCLGPPFPPCPCPMGSLPASISQFSAGHGSLLTSPAQLGTFKATGVHSETFQGQWSTGEKGHSGRSGMYFNARLSVVYILFKSPLPQI